MPFCLEVGLLENHNLWIQYDTFLLEKNYSNNGNFYDQLITYRFINILNKTDMPPKAKAPSKSPDPKAKKDDKKDSKEEKQSPKK